MKSFILFFFLFAASYCLALGSVVRTETETEDECNVPSIVAYCLDMVHLGAEYESPSAEVEELKHDVEEAPFGMCPWGHWNGQATVEDCMEVLGQYADIDDEEEDEEVEMEMDTSGRSFIKKIKKAFKKFGKKIKKGFNKVATGVKKVVKKVSKFCKKNKSVCMVAVELGKELLSGTKEKKTS